jgi:hypothetical protein
MSSADEVPGRLSRARRDRPQHECVDEPTETAIGRMSIFWATTSPRSGAVRRSISASDLVPLGTTKCPYAADGGSVTKER